MLSFKLPTFPEISTTASYDVTTMAALIEHKLCFRSVPLVMKHVNRPLATAIEEAVALVDLINSMVDAKGKLRNLADVNIVLTIIHV